MHHHPSSPLGPSQEKVIKYLIHNVGASFHQIREGCASDRPTKYMSNLLYELRKLNLITVETSIDSNTATKYSANLKELINIINVGHLIVTGEFIGVPDAKPIKS